MVGKSITPVAMAKSATAAATTIAVGMRKKYTMSDVIDCRVSSLPVTIAIYLNRLPYVYKWNV
jgi:hypothetical protein